MRERGSAFLELPLSKTRLNYAIVLGDKTLIQSKFPHPPVIVNTNVFYHILKSIIANSNSL